MANHTPSSESPRTPLGISRRQFNKLVAAGLVTAAGSLTHVPNAFAVSDPSAEVPPMNSWRFKDGQFIEDQPDANEPSLLSDSSHWGPTANGYVNGNGQLIPYAVKRGMDVSEWQGVIDWDRAGRDDIDFAIIRSCWAAERIEGGVDKYKDEQWDRNAAECERLQIPYGTYVYSYATTPDYARREAEHVLKILGGRKLAYPIFFDMEDAEVDAAGNYYELARAFCERIEAAGYAAGVYANLYWWTTKLTDGRFDRWIRWVARYQDSATDSGFGGMHSFWQCTNKGAVAGIGGYVDLNFEISTAARPVLRQTEILQGRFYDCPADAWYARDGWVPYAVQHSLMSGGKYPTSQKLTGYFDPEGQITRGQVAAVLFRIANPGDDSTTNPNHYGWSTGFSDGGSQRYYYSAVAWLKEQGISTGDKAADGTPLNTFRPDASITRQELAALVQRFAENQGAVSAGLGSGSDAGAGSGDGDGNGDGDNNGDDSSSVLDQFVDGKDVLPYAREAMVWCYNAGIITGGAGAAAGMLQPGANATRAQAAKIFTVLHRDVLKK